MTTTIRPNQRPGKLSSKFGAAFAAFENNGSESSVPQAFRSSVLRKTTAKPTVGSKETSPNDSSREKTDTRPSQSNESQRNEKTGEQATQVPSGANGSDLTQSTPDPGLTVKRNFRVSTTLADRAKIFEQSNTKASSTSGNAAYRNARQGLRKVKPTSSVNRPTNESSSALASGTVSSGINKDEITAEAEDGSECYLEFVPKDTAHSTIGCVVSDDEYEEVWEEETVESTEEEDDYSWEEETIEDDFLEDEEYSVEVK